MRPEAVVGGQKGLRAVNDPFQNFRQVGYQSLLPANWFCIDKVDG
jgi:hypothetical protein